MQCIITSSLQMFLKNHYWNNFFPLSPWVKMLYIPVFKDVFMCVKQGYLNLVQCTIELSSAFDQNNIYKIPRFRKETEYQYSYIYIFCFSNSNKWHTFHLFVEDFEIRAHNYAYQHSFSQFYKGKLLKFLLYVEEYGAIQCI